MTRTFDIVVAADEGGAIGLAGKLPWKLPGDTAHFKRLTSEAPAGMRNAVIMGRKTWNTIPRRFRPLDGRLNVVVTRDESFEAQAGVLVATLESALERLVDPQIHRVFVIGGGEIYRAALQLPECTSVYLTRVEGRHHADAFFPPLDADFRLIERSPRHEENGIGYRFELWRRPG